METQSFFGHNVIIQNCAQKCLTTVKYCILTSVCVCVWMLACVCMRANVHKLHLIQLQKGFLFVKVKYSHSKMVVEGERWYHYLGGEVKAGTWGSGSFHKVWMPPKNVSSDPCEVIAEWEEREGQDRRIDDRRPERKIIHVHSCIRSPA